MLFNKSSHVVAVELLPFCVSGSKAVGQQLIHNTQVLLQRAGYYFRLKTVNSNIVGDSSFIIT